MGNTAGRGRAGDDFAGFRRDGDLLCARGLHDLAVRIGEDLLNSPTIRLVHVDEQLFLEAWDYFVQHHDQAYSLTDCVSFILMTRLGLRSALTFDHHFTQAGFDRLPGV